MFDSYLRLACKRVKPTAAFPAPGEGRIERKNTRDEGVGLVELPGYG